MFIKPQFTTNSLNIFQMNQCMQDHGMSQFHKGPGEFVKQTCVSEVSLHFEFELDTLGFEVSPQKK
jgi:hypothetical protein